MLLVPPFGPPEDDFVVISLTNLCVLGKFEDLGDLDNFRDFCAFVDVGDFDCFGVFFLIGLAFFVLYKFSEDSLPSNVFTNWSAVFFCFRSWSDGMSCIHSFWVVHVFFFVL